MSLSDEKKCYPEFIHVALSKISSFSFTIKKKLQKQATKADFTT